jgi:hypothetical protein
LHKLPARKSEDESPAEFWSPVERADLLIEALALYDELAAERSERRHTRRETKKQFGEHIKRKGRQAEAEEQESLGKKGGSERGKVGKGNELGDKREEFDGQVGWV